MFLNVLQQLPVWNFSKSKEGPKTIKVACDFSADTVYEAQLLQSRQLGIFETIRAIYFDCKNCTNPVVFDCVETGQSITFRPGRQGYRNVLVSEGMRFRFTGTAGDTFNANLLNVDMPEATWTTSDTASSIPLSSLTNALAQYDIIGRKSVGAGAWEDCTRTDLLLAGTDLANTFSQAQVISVTSGVPLTINTTSGGTISTNGDGVLGGYANTRYQTNTGGASNSLRKARGSLASPLVVAVNDTLGTYNFIGYGGSLFVNGASISAVVIQPVPLDTAMGTRLLLNASPLGSATLTEVVRLEVATGLSMFGANVVVDSNRLLKRRPFTFATLPAVGVSQDGAAVITDGAAVPVWLAAAAGGAAVRTPVICNGAVWNNG